jgi:hypothetical protein
VIGYDNGSEMNGNERNYEPENGHNHTKIKQGLYCPHANVIK